MSARDREERQAWTSAWSTSGLPFQIRRNRDIRGLTQAQLAKVTGMHQSQIARLESYGATHEIEPSIRTLIRLAHAFDCALLVQFVEHDELQRDWTPTTRAHDVLPSDRSDRQRVQKIRKRRDRAAAKANDELWREIERAQRAKERG